MVCGYQSLELMPIDACRFSTTSCSDRNGSSPLLETRAIQLMAFSQIPFAMALCMNSWELPIPPKKVSQYSSDTEMDDKKQSGVGRTSFAPTFGDGYADPLLWNV
jgi:hypothetical protein